MVASGSRPANARQFLTAKYLRVGRCALKASDWKSRIALLAAGLLLGLGQLSSQSLAAEVDFPVIPPENRIRVTAREVATERRGAYDILAFTGKVKLSQGSFTATADEIVLWLERGSSDGVEIPGKAICYLRGNVDAEWEQTHRLRDHSWTGRLFSYFAVEYEAEFKVRRYDIPELDWNREPSRAIRPVQFSRQLNQPQQSGSPPSQGMLPVPGFAQDSSYQMLEAPPLLNASGQANANQQGPNPIQNNRVPATPGGIEWSPNGSTNSGSVNNANNGRLIPQGGLTIPQDGSAPYPANTFPGSNTFPGGNNNNAAENILPAPQQPLGMAPSFPDASTFPGTRPQVALQVETPSPFAAKSIQFQPRSNNRSPEITFQPDPVSGENIGQVRGGFRLIINGVQLAGQGGQSTDFGTVTLEADNAVFWIRGNGGAGGIESLTSTPERPLELYLDGNIVFNQGNRVIYAERMYYNVSSEYGMVLSAEVLTPVPQYQGLLRLKADVLQQQDRENFIAYGAAITSSRLGVPRYWLQANEVKLQDTRSETDLSVYAPTDANRGTNMKATAKNNFVYLGGVPIFYWPTFSSRLSDSSFYLSSIKFKNDTIFGTQIYTEFDGYQLLGIEGPDGTNLRVSADYLSDRGPALGARFDYDRPTFFLGIPGQGFSDAWFISDSGLDTLGSDRINLTPSETLRGRTYSRNRFFISPNTELMVETGFISDDNFLEQYFENEWDQDKDLSTAARLRNYRGNQMFELSAAARVNDFFTETESLPEIDHYWLGQDLFGERLTWHEHTSVGYVHQRVASTPTDPVDAAKFALRPWETDSEGVKALTRQELSMPLTLGAFELVPFIGGEAAFWNEDVNQDDLTRLTGQAGVRSSLPFWRVYPNMENRLLDLRGIAHKVNLKSEFFYADSSQNVDLLPLYDPLDDNSQEHFRRRLVFNTFGGILPPEFDERSYALRTGMQRWVTAGSSEIVDDQMQARFGVEQRWQTKRGLPGRERIVDLVSFDADFIYFPKAERDNFGEEVGVVNYNFKYHVGDRLTLLSDGYFDVFSQGLKTVSAGAKISRPGRGDAYLGFLSIEGPISANIANGNINYRLNEKWILTSGIAFDFSDVGSIGQSLALTRIGETALVRVGINVDSGRDNVAFNFNIEPRFLPTVRLGSLGGELIPPAGLFGLE